MKQSKFSPKQKIKDADDNSYYLVSTYWWRKEVVNVKRFGAVSLYVETKVNKIDTNKSLSLLCKCRETRTTTTYLKILCSFSVVLWFSKTS